MSDAPVRVRYGSISIVTIWLVVPAIETGATAVRSTLLPGVTSVAIAVESGV
jgi:hypothetical protein